MRTRKLRNTHWPLRLGEEENCHTRPREPTVYACSHRVACSYLPYSKVLQKLALINKPVSLKSGWPLMDYYFLLHISAILGQGCSSDSRALDQHTTVIGFIPQCSMGFFSQSQLSVQTLLGCPYSPLVWLHAWTSVHMLKMPSAGSHTVVCTQENTASTALEAAIASPRHDDPIFPQGINEKC